MPPKPAVLTKKMYVKATATRGFIRGNATTTVGQVLAQARKTKKILYRMTAEPETAQRWYRVEFVHAQGRERNIPGVRDARWGPWEYLQQPRIVPLARGHQLLSRNMVSMHLPTTEVTTRLQFYNDDLDIKIQIFQGEIWVAAVVDDK